MGRGRRGGGAAVIGLS